MRGSREQHHKIREVRKIGDLGCDVHLEMDGSVGVRGREGKVVETARGCKATEIIVHGGKVQKWVIRGDDRRASKKMVKT